ncbi:MAG: protein kinase domain-containing protein [Blastococcus sp.]
MVEPGRRCLGDRYELERLVAAGGMGQVWRGHDIALHRPVAVKVLRSEYTGDPTFVARFRAEAQHAASLSHPNIAAVFDYGEEIAHDGTGETLAYLVMELVEGEPLSALLAREGRLDTATTLSFLRQTAFALAEAHDAGMVHRDVKPGNILVRPDGSVKITDFGIAWSARSVALTRTGQVIGTPQYLSPEQAEGRAATPASDVYALGLIGYECLTGHPAFDGDNAVTIALKQVRQEPEPLPGTVPVDVRRLIGRSLAKDPASRLVDGAAVVSAIEDIAAGRPLPDPPPTVSVGAVGADGVPAPRSGGADTGVSSAASRSPAVRRRGRVVTALLPLLALLAGAGIAAALLQLMAHDPPRATAQAAETHGASGVVLVARDYIGRPVDEVANQLAAYGLTVHRRAVPSSDAAPGTVTAVDPTGVTLRPGQGVTVSYAPAASAGSRTVGGGVTGAAFGSAATSSAAPTTGSVSSSSVPSSLAAGSSAPDTSTPPSDTESSSSSSTSSTPDTSTPTDTTPTTAADTTPSTP